MIWLTWRQFRGPALMMAGVLTVFGAALALTGPGLADDYAKGISGCAGHADGCARFLDRFLDSHQSAFLGVSGLLLLLPALIGLFWGAPLVARELETGTFRMAWTQSVRRTRWLAAKVALVGLAAMAAAGIGTLAVTWWASPLDKSAVDSYPRLEAIVFATRGIVPVGYAAFAFALGVTVGMLVRRALPAMALTLAVFALVQIAMPTFVRPQLAEPVTTTSAFSTRNIDGVGEGGLLHTQARVADPGAWILSSRTVDKDGRTVPLIDLPDADMARCDRAPSPGEAMQCVTDTANRLGYRQEATYHPASRYWPFQWAETGIYAALALGLTGFCFWWTKRRL
ncbi:ABC transporter permease subunit [Streptomyces indicus]|uniref:ABC-2 family transporter protein n=1 Tax=Streptomyces indicus TaxID=417292 RepID=A0A1G9FI18_9ACTN|nr:ABC transporter permease subunit [Streptomyces indicus]SDK88044.1 ABC-2 family transporter protein [Streptomyces indicus]